MNKHLTHFVTFTVLVSALYFWPSCEKAGNEPPLATENDSTGKNDTTPKPPDTTNLKGWVVSTLAGTNAHGYVDGMGTQARFNTPNDVALGNTGELYVFEATNKCIRKVTSDGQVTTFIREDSASGIYLGFVGYALGDGAGTFYYPYKENHIRTLTINGGSVLAGSMTSSGYVDGPSTVARFKFAQSIARDGNGNLYVGDRNEFNAFVIRKITPAGLVSTLTLNDQTGISNNNTAGISFYTLAADSIGNVYFTPGNYKMIKKVDPQGNVSVVAGSTTEGHTDGKGQAARFKGIVDMEVDAAGNVWVCDTYNNLIRKVTPDGTVTTIAGNVNPGYSNGSGIAAKFNFPWAIALDKSGIMYVLEVNNHAVRKIEYRP